MNLDDLDAMRYRHLWIAYAAIWMLIMAFVFRTARRQAKTQVDLDRLSARLDELERRDG